jgi:hypothetical protein
LPQNKIGGYAYSSKNMEESPHLKTPSFPDKILRVFTGMPIQTEEKPMRNKSVLVLSLFSIFFITAVTAADYWPQFRGPPSWTERSTSGWKKTSMLSALLPSPSLDRNPSAEGRTQPPG